MNPPTGTSKLPNAVKASAPIVKKKITKKPGVITPDTDAKP